MPLTDRKNPRTTGHGGLAALMVMATAPIVACSRPGEVDVPPPRAPFERYPYVQAVTDSSATVVWMTGVPSQDTLIYWTLAAGDTSRVIEPSAARHHRVALAPLAADSRVGYRVLPGTPGARSSVHVFRTAPRPGEPDTTIVLAFGDSGWGSDAQVQLARQMERREFDLALHTGDIAYDDGSEEDFTQRHFRVYRSLLAETPLFPAIGNHDVRADGGRSFDRAFVFPGRAEQESGRRYYSFDWGRTHFVALNSLETPEAWNLRADGEQARWLACDLAHAASDPGVGWLIVFMHHPVYSAATGLSSHGSDRELQETLGAIFDRFRVDLVLTGHDHIYERSRPIRSGKVDTTTPGTVYVVTGGGGASLMWRQASHVWHTASSASVHHFLELRIGASRLVGTVIGRNGELIDSFVIQETRRDSQQFVEGEQFRRDCPRDGRR